MDRQRFLQSSAALLAGATVARPWPALAAAASPTILRAGRHVIEVHGKSASVLRITRPNGARGLVADTSTGFRVHLENGLSEPTLVHWHGLTPPWRQDGVPEISGPAVQPGASTAYDFPLRVSGTYWMHSHQGFQEQQLLTAPLIVHDSESHRADRQEVVVLLHDFSFSSPEEIYASLRNPKAMSGMDMNAMPDMPGMSSASPAAPDLNDVKYDAFLANERTLDDPDVVRVERGGRVLLRIINGASASNFHMDLGALNGRLVAVDGRAVHAVTGSVFPIAIAQRLDIELTLPQGEGAYPLLAVLEGERRQTGIVLATANARVRKVERMASSPTTAVNLDLERSLRAATPLELKAADRVVQIALTGSMQKYVWSLNDRTYPQSAPFRVAKNERVEFVMTNRTPMSHPMHLHGHTFQVVAINGYRFAGAMRDTVLVAPKSSVTIAFDANNPGRWFFHCHNLYHMTSGMANTVVYEGY